MTDRLEAIMDDRLNVPDPLGHSMPLPEVETFFPRGFPLVLRTNSADVVAAGREAWGEFAPAFETEAIELRVVVREADTAPPPSTAERPTFRAQGHLLAVLMGADNFAVCDMRRGFGAAFLTPALARNRVFTGYYFLRCTAFACLSYRYVTPIHAACLARDGRGILLVGDAGMGKSSLAWTCGQAGLTFVADDCTWLMRECEEPVLIGKPQRLRFPPEALELLPDLKRLPRLETAMGNGSFEIRTADVAGLRCASQCRPWRLVFLDRRSEDAAELAPVDAAEAARRLASTRPRWEARVWKEQEASLLPLLSGGALELRYSSLAAATRAILNLE